MFAEELGLDPGPRLSELERAILRQDTSLQAPPSVPVDQQRKRRTASHRRTGWIVALAAGFVIALAIAVALVAGLRDPPRTSPKPVVLTGNSVAVLDPATTSVVAEIPVGARPSGIAAGAGSVWVGNRDDNTLLRIDPRSRTVVRTIGLGVEPREVTVAAQSARGLSGIALRKLLAALLKKSFEPADVEPFGGNTQDVARCPGREELGVVPVGEDASQL